MKRSEYVEIVRLAAACWDRRITSEQHERLQLLLRSGAAARRVYLEYVDLHARLGQYPGGTSSPEPKTGKSWLDEPRDAADGGVPTVAEVAETFGRSHQTPKLLASFATRGKAIRWLMLAATLGFVAAALSWWLLLPEPVVIVQGGEVSQAPVRGSAFLAPDEVRALDAAWRAGQRRNWQKWVGSIRRDDALVLYSEFGPNNSDRGPQVAAGGSREAATVQGRWPGRRAVEFASGDDRIIVRFNEDIKLPQATFLAWVRLDVCQDRYQTLCFAPGSLPINRTDPEFIGRFQWSLNRQSALRFAVVTGEDKPDSDAPTFEGAAFSREGAPVPASRWQHLAVTYDSETRLVHFFTDGKLNNVAQPNVAPPLVIPRRLFLGNVATETATPRDLSGRLDEFVLLSRVLTGDEIRAAYENGNPYRAAKD